MVQLYVSQLRRLVADADAEIVTHGRGYELRVAAEAVDVARFERLVEQAGRGDDGLAVDAARRALGMWHGAALADVAGEPFAAAEVRRLDELRLTAAELAIDGDLAAGREPEALAQLERLIVEHPLRERLHAQRMLALYRSGRQAEALQAFAAARRRLVDELGIEPGDGAAHAARADPAPGPRAATACRAPAPVVRTEQRAPRPRDGRRRSAGTRSRSRRLRRSSSPSRVFAATRLGGPDELRGIADGRGRRDRPGRGRDHRAVPRSVASRAPWRRAPGSVWAASVRQGTVSRIDRDGDRVATIDVGPAPVALAFGAGSVWVAGGEDGAIAQLDPVAHRVVQRIAVGNGLRAVAVGHGAVWAAAALDGAVARIDLRSGRVTRRIAVGGRPAALATSADAVWVAAEEGGTVVRIDARTDEIVEAVAVGNGPGALAVGLGAVWVANRQDGTVSRIDPKTESRDRHRPRRRAPVALAVAGGRSGSRTPPVPSGALDPRTRRISDTVRTGSSPAGLAAVGRRRLGDGRRAARRASRRHPARRQPALHGSENPCSTRLAGPVTTLVYDALLGLPAVGRPRRGAAAWAGSPPPCRSPPTRAAATSSASGPASATRTARPSARATSARRCSASSPRRPTSWGEPSTRSPAPRAAAPSRSAATSRAASRPTIAPGRSPSTCAAATRRCSAGSRSRP